MTLKTTRNQALNIRVTPAEAEMVRAAADAMGWSVTDVMLAGALAVGADIVGRWEGPGAPQVKRAERAFKAVQREQLEPVRARAAAGQPLADFAAVVQQTSLTTAANRQPQEKVS